MMMQQGEMAYPGRSIGEMFRVVRIVTPPEDANHWVSTSWGRSWHRDAAGDWRSVAPEPSDCGRRYDDAFMRELLAEQLAAYGVLTDDPIWERH